MRLKKVKGAKEIIEKSPNMIKNPENYKGNIKEIFNNKNDIHIEIGTGKGSFIYNMALLNPHINFIAIEKYESVLYNLANMLNNNLLSNLKFLCIDAINIDKIFDNEISTIYLNFSDPWPKKRHTKRRLTSETFLQKYDLICKKQYNIIMKTDSQELFEYSVKSFNNNNYKINYISLDLHKTNIFNIETEYEKKFSNQGFKIYKIEVYK